MDAAQFPGQCGIGIISDLGYGANDGGGVTELKYEIENLVDKGYTKCMVTINQHQIKYWVPQLKKLKFKLIQSFVNKRTKNSIQVYIKTI